MYIHLTNNEFNRKNDVLTVVVVVVVDENVLKDNDIA